MQHNISSPSKSIRGTLLCRVICYIISLSHVYWVEMTSHSRRCYGRTQWRKTNERIKSLQLEISCVAVRHFQFEPAHYSESILFRVYPCTRQLLIPYFILKGREKRWFQVLPLRIIIKETNSFGARRPKRTIDRYKYTSEFLITEE